MKTKLDAAVVAAAECPPYKRRLDVFCTHNRGLVLEVRPSGGKTYHVRYTDQHGALRQVKIARADQITFDQARKKARQMIAEAALGHDLVATKQERRAVPLLNDLIDDHIKHARTTLRSAKTVEGYLKRVRARFGRLRLTDIRTQDITLWLGDLKKEGLAPATILKTLVMMNRTFELGAQWDVPGTDKNPVKGVPRPKFSNARQTYIDGDQTARLLAAAAKSRNPQLAAIISLLLLTGMRVSELLGSRWVNVDTGRRALFIPMTKNGRSRTIPLSQAAIDVIEALQRKDGAIFLFPNPRDPKKHLTTIKHGWQTAREEAGLPDLHIHDLRHSFASAAVAAGNDLYHVGRILGHQSHASTSRYAHVANTTLLAAVEAGAAQLNLSAKA